MYVSETTFVHLRETAEAQLLQELERRRVARERAVTAPRTGLRLRDLLPGLHRPERTARERLRHS